MKIKKLDHGYLLRLELGEELKATLTAFANKEGIDGCFFHGLGGATSASLGIYRLDDDHEYHFMRFDGPREVISMNGDISVSDGKRMVHCHATISGSDLKVFGGHVDEILVGATCEIFMDTRVGKIERKQSDNVGLHLLDLEDYEL